MYTGPITTEILQRSVIAVPPLARTADLRINHAENAKLIRHLEAGGVRSLLYGGNAVLGHVAISEYRELLENLRSSAGAETWVIPSVGPGFGMLLDQAAILKEFEFPTAMLLPTNDPTTSAGIATAIRKLVEISGKPCLLYIKRDGFIDVATVRKLFVEKLISCIKYAIVRENPGDDPYLNSLIDAVGPELIVSGMGEQPAIVHLRKFRLAGFTAGCVCIAPELSTRILEALLKKDDATAERIRKVFQPLENLRDSISPVRVLHEAVRLTGIAETGPITPLLSEIGEEERVKVLEAVRGVMSVKNC
jgi:dihydrodipicolinate synthase/N-acetylneuraminate lyase